MPNERRFLILGASGLLGRHLRERLGPSKSIATFHNHAIDGGVHFDAGRMRLRDTLLSGRHGIDTAFILYGVTALDDCARDPAGSARINVDSIVAAITDLMDAGIKPVFASSDAVFDGSRGAWRENDPTSPLLTYGSQKLEVERFLASRAGAWIVARLSKLVSGFAEPRNPLNEWIDQIENGESIRCATDLVFSPADVVEAADALVRLAEGASTGVFHVCGPEPLSRMDLFEKLAAAVAAHGGPQARPIACRMTDLALFEPRPLDVSMDPSKLYAEIGKSFRTMQRVCMELAARRYGAVAGQSSSQCSTLA